MAGKTLSYFNLTGGLNTVQTMATINSTTNRTESPDMVNIEYFKLSGLKTMKGNVALNKSNPLSGTPLEQRINFGYEYVKGNNRYLIVADRKTLYEYNPTNDSFTSLISFDGEGGDGITICGFANGIVAASPNNNYMIYYCKDRNQKVLGQVTTNDTTTVTIDSYTNLTATCSEDVLGKGDMVLIGTTLREVDTVQPAEIRDPDNPSQWIPNPNKDKFTVLEEVPSGTFDFKLTNYTKIYCVYKSTVQDGNTTRTTITNFTPKIVQSHQGRLWVAAKINNEDTASYLIYSDLGNIHNTFEGGDAVAGDAGYFAEFWEDTSEITAIGNWDKYVVVHKKENTYLVDTSNSDATTWKVERYSEYTCDNQQGFVKANNGYYTYCSTAGGIYPMIQRTIYSAISQGADASIKIRDTFLNLNIYALDKIYAVYHPYKKYIMFYMPMIGESGSNNCYILDLQTKSWLHRRIPQNVTAAFEFDNKVYIGTEDGKVYEEFRGLDFDGQPIPFSWKSPWFIWGNGTNWTTTREMRVKMSQEGTNNFYVRNRRDGDERYKERTITNTSGKVDSLVWDEGWLEADKTVGYKEHTPVYRYIFREGEEDQEIYYSLDSVLDKYSLMFSNKPTTMSILGGIPNGALSYRQPRLQGQSYDTVEAGNDTAYAFVYRPTKAQYQCYKSTQDSNIKAWVTYNDTSKAIVNVINEETIVKYGFTGYNVDQQPDGNRFRVDAQYADAITNGTTQENIPFEWFNGTSWVSQVRFGNRDLPIVGGYGMTAGGYSAWGVGGRYQNIQTFMYPISYSLRYWQYLQLARASQYDLRGASDKEVWNGKSTRSGKNKTVTTYTSEYVIIDGVRFNRYTAGDEGSVTDSSKQPDWVYGRTPELTKGQTVYDRTLATELGTVSSVNGTNYTINGKVYVPNQSENKYGLGTRWFLTVQKFANGTQGDVVRDEEQNIEYAYAPYLYTGEYDAEGVKRLTDTKWDESIWVNTGQVTKRFPIDRQYFQTLQIEFCGETINQGIELYGFEIDGIQLTEVPW